MITAPARTASVAAARSFIRRRRQGRRWFDWYAVGLIIAVAIGVLSDFLAGPVGRLMASPGRPVPGQAEAGAALVIGAAAGLIAAAQAVGPLTLSPADTSWLLLSPLDRRGLLRRPAGAVAALATLTGAVLGVLALAMAGPYLRSAAHRVTSAGLVLAAVGGAGFFLAAVLTAVLGQPRPGWQARLRAAGAVLFAAATAGAVTSQRWTALSQRVAGWFGGISTGTLGVLAVIAVAAAGAVAVAVWRLLPRFPARVVRTDSARARTTLSAASTGNALLLTWIAEDNHWRGRILATRPWPRLSPAFALAWADWRRLARRPAVLAMLTASTLAPALAGSAITGHDRGLVVAAVLLAGAIAAGAQGTLAVRRDANDPTLSRLLGVSAAAALRARAVLPALLSGGWLTLAFALLVPAGVLHGWLWPLLGPLAGPGVAAAALRIARTPPINPAEKTYDTPLGNISPGLMTRAVSVAVGVAGSFPALRAVAAGHAGGGILVAQVAVSAAVLGGYLVLAAAPAASATPQAR